MLQVTSGAPAAARSVPSAPTSPRWATASRARAAPLEVRREERAPNPSRSASARQRLWRLSPNSSVRRWARPASVTAASLATLRAVTRPGAVRAVLSAPSRATPTMPAAVKVALPGRTLTHSGRWTVLPASAPAAHSSKAKPASAPLASMGQARTGTGPARPARRTRSRTLPATPWGALPAPMGHTH